MLWYRGGTKKSPNRGMDDAAVISLVISAISGHQSVALCSSWSNLVKS